MENQVVFINHDAGEFHETLGITEEKIIFIHEKVSYFLLKDSVISKALEKIIEGLNPNETVYAVHVYSKEVINQSLMELMINQLQKVPLSLMVLVPLLQAETEHREQLQSFSENYQKINKV